jgi:hypothetical protein
MSPDQLNELVKKYSEVTELPLNYLVELGKDTTWNYLFTEGDTICVTDYETSVEPFADKEITEQDLDNYLEESGCKAYPTQDFKINLSNMTEAEKEVAKEWLKCVAESRGKGLGAIELLSSPDHLYMESYYGTVTWSSKECWDKSSYQELTLTFSAPTITSWSLPEEKSEKELQLEELVGKLQQQLEEAQQKLKEIR